MMNNLYLKSSAKNAAQNIIDIDKSSDSNIDESFEFEMQQINFKCLLSQRK